MPFRILAIFSLFSLLFVAQTGLADRIDLSNLFRLTAGKNFDSIEAERGPETSEIVRQETAFYSLNLGFALSSKAAVSDWTNALQVEAGNSVEGGAAFQQASASSAYSVRGAQDNFSLTLTGSGTHGDLNYRRPLISQTDLLDTLAEAEDSEEVASDEPLTPDARFYSAQIGYGYSLSAFTRLSMEAQSSVYTQDTVEVITHRLSPRYTQLLSSFWDTSLFVAGTHQRAKGSLEPTEAIEAGWSNTFRLSVQDVLTQSVGAIQTIRSDKRSSNHTLGLAYSHLFDNNKLFQTDSLQGTKEPGKDGELTGTRPAHSFDSAESEKMMIEKLREAKLKNLASIYWTRSLSAAEEGREQYITEAYGLIYDYSHSHGHDVQVSGSESYQLDPLDQTRIQRIDQTVRAAYIRSMRLFNRDVAGGLDRFTIEGQYQQTKERNLLLKGVHWLALISWASGF
ncbi:MAG TPA: hypothetical protein VE954_21175 [Oligoflexus sp.]|uniref:hypothetical protein n=1 Tax=Oligoflexus sp. TaxID=1971216 RepID=UPI002D627FDD|nr:hypothetical protein [Oligoflexus sp.]HYX35617.1 hypothetical protein [Oligoflexus sp.]